MSGCASLRSRYTCLSGIACRLRDDTLVSVYFAKEYSANAEAEVLRSLLASAGIESVIRWTPPTFQNSGGVSLLVLSSQQRDAEQIIREAQSEEYMADQEHSQDDFVTVFSSGNHDAEAEAETVHSVLESAGIESVIVRENVQELPTGGVEVRVLEHDAEEARNVIAAAQQAGGE